MTISKELLDELLKGVERPEDLLGDAGLMKELKLRLMERMLGAECCDPRSLLQMKPGSRPVSALAFQRLSWVMRPNFGGRRERSVLVDGWAGRTAQAALSQGPRQAACG